MASDSNRVADLLVASACYNCVPDGLQIPVIIERMQHWPTGEAPCQHATVDAWVTQVAANGGTPVTEEIYENLCLFMRDLDAGGITPAIKTMCCFVPGTTSPATTPAELIRAITPLIGIPGTNPWTNTNFVAANLSNNGLQGDPNKRLNTGMNPNVYFTTTNAGATVYNLAAANDNSSQFGCGSGSTLFNLQCDDAGGNSIFDAYNFTSGGGRITGLNSLWSGFLSGNRRAVNPQMCLYKAKSSVPFTTVTACHNGTGGTIPNEACYCFCRVTGGSAFNTGNALLSFAALHDGLTQAQATAFFNAVQAMRVRFNGGYL